MPPASPCILRTLLRRAPSLLGSFHIGALSMRVLGLATSHVRRKEKHDGRGYTPNNEPPWKRLGPSGPDDVRAVSGHDPLRSTSTVTRTGGAKMDVRDKVVLVTGASGGIGKATAELLDGKGAKVALVARSEDKLREICADLRGAFSVTADMSDTRSVRDMVAQVLKHFGRVDALVNNAGRGMIGPIEAIDMDDLKSVSYTHLTLPTNREV